MNVTVQERHHQCGLQTVPGDIADENHLAAVRQGNDIEEISTHALGHAVLEAGATPTADRRTFREENLLDPSGQIDIDVQRTVAVH
jgi:hypothetical protein